MSQGVRSADSATANPTSGAAPPTPGGASSPASSEVPPDESSPDAEAAPQTTSHDNPGMATPMTDDTDSANLETDQTTARSEERRVGKESKYRWSRQNKR